MIYDTLVTLKIAEKLANEARLDQDEFLHDPSMVIVALYLRNPKPMECHIARSIPSIPVQAHHHIVRSSPEKRRLNPLP